jgi:hypothetical protein
VLEANAIKPHSDRDAANEGGVILADQEHEFFAPSLHSSLPGLTRQPSKCILNFMDAWIKSGHDDRV